MAARAVVFGQASALVTAVVSGMYGGVGVFLLGFLDVPARRDQALYAGLAVAAGIAVIAAALYLERVCKLPEDDEPPGASPQGRERPRYQGCRTRCPFTRKPGCGSSQ